MCHKNIFTYVYPDGHKGEHIKHDLCDDSRHGLPCKYTKTFQHPTEYVRPGQLSPPALTYGQFPPTPPLSSHSASASDSEHSTKERSGVYVNGEKVIDLNRRQSRRDKGERTVYVEGSSLSRTPPRRYSVSRSSPSTSPREEGTYMRESRRRERSPESRDRSDRNRSTSSHYRGPIIEVKVVNEKQRDHSTHRRQGSSSKSSSQSGDDDERRRRRRDSHVRFEDDPKTEEKKKKLQSEIERQNAAIANRPIVPSSKSSSSSTTTANNNSNNNNARYRRGSVVVDRNETSLITAMDQLNIEREKRRREKRAEEKRARDEEEAQRQRLKDRMAPKRHAAITQAPTRPRPKMLYEDAYYAE